MNTHSTLHVDCWTASGLNRISDNHIESLSYRIYVDYSVVGSTIYCLVMVTWSKWNILTENLLFQDLFFYTYRTRTLFALSYSTELYSWSLFKYKQTGRNNNECVRMNELAHWWIFPTTKPKKETFIYNATSISTVRNFSSVYTSPNDIIPEKCSFFELNVGSTELDNVLCVYGFSLLLVERLCRLWSQPTTKSLRAIFHTAPAMVGIGTVAISH